MEEYQDIKDNLALILKVALWVLFVGLSLIYVVMYVKASSAYMQIWSDEPGYYLNAFSYARNTTVHAGITISQYASPLGRCDSHGFAYPMLHGLIAKVFGWHRTNLLTANMVFLALCLAALLAGRVALMQCAAAMILLLLYFITPMYAFSDMQESIHLLFATVAAILLWQIHRREPGSLARAWLIGGYIAAIAIFSLFRPSWAAWLIALGPLSRTRRGAAWFAGLLAVAFVITLIYMSVGFAPYPYGFSFRMTQKLHASGVFAALKMVFANGAENLRLFFFSPSSLGQGQFKSFSSYFYNAATQGINYYYLTKMVYLVLVLFFLVHGAIWGDRLSLAMAAVGVCTFALLMLLYDSAQYREHRPLAAIYTLGVVLLAARQFKVATAILMIVMLVMFPPALGRTAHDIQQRNDEYARASRLEPLGEALARVGRAIDRTRPVSVYLSGATGGEKIMYILTNLPVRGAKGEPIYYSINPTEKEAGQAIAQMAPSVDYILYLRPSGETSMVSAKAVKGMPLLLKNEYFELFKTR